MMSQSLILLVCVDLCCDILLTAPEMILIGRHYKKKQKTKKKQGLLKTKLGTARWWACGLDLHRPSRHRRPVSPLAARCPGACAALSGFPRNRRRGGHPSSRFSWRDLDPEVQLLFLWSVCLFVIVWLFGFCGVFSLFFELPQTRDASKQTRNAKTADRVRPVQAGALAAVGGRARGKLDRAQGSILGLQ